MDLIKTMLAQALYLYSIVLIIYILMSWVPGARESRFGEFLGRLSEPYLEVFRRIIPPIGMIDISPIVALLVLNFAQRGLCELFFMLGI